MTLQRHRWIGIGLIGGVVGLGLMAGGWATRAQDGPAATGTRFEFLVVESFDAQYQGDTPGHVGRGGLGRSIPRVALGDPVYRGSDVVGKVSRLVWTEARQSLEVEIDPTDGKNRIQIGDPVWIRLGPEPKSR